ncbi:hypothetical protein [Dermacoccus sp. CCH2-D9]|mgnify:CR=1 FL=1|uniref:hypothetical protein n=1 Tax=Dermacoccus sp. CCH2-D9 TaxID=1768779 RepID=UPI000785AFFC|nr:hypothetical protein [Dermacoccus sp. CCH2-D9]
MVWSILWGGGIALGLRWLYRYLSVEWPERYVAPDQLVSIIVSRTWWTYAMFRCGPVAMAGILTVHGADQLALPSLAALVAMTVVHVLSSSVFAMWTMPKNEWARQARLQFHAISAVGVILTAGLVWFTRGWTAGLAPDVHGLSTNIWATVLGLILAKGCYDVLSKTPRREYLHSWAARSVDQELLARITSAGCSHTGALEAIALAEAVERPRWFRRIERFAPGVESTGVMQIKGGGILTDQESVDLFLVRHQQDCGRLEREGATDDAIYRHHNPDPHFVEMCRQLRPEWG